ncbi:MAG: YihY/virulence factor BrkB family protein [Blastocatellia bacterium]|nr:YihY/virulence factor BrkB family protein [Blastocatellia bacterium]
MVPFPTIRKLVWNTVLETFNTGCIGYAKEAAYSLVLSFFPMLIFATALFAVLGQNYMGEIVETLQRILPAGSRSMVCNYLTEFFKNQPPRGLLLFSFLATIFPAAGLMATFTKAFDHIYSSKEQRGFWQEQLVVYLLVLALGLPILIATIATAMGTLLEKVIIRWMGDRPIFGTAWILGRWAIIWLTVLLIAMLLYHLAPSRTPAWRHIIPGAVLASVMWILLTIGFGAYVANYASYDRVYGSLGAGIVLLVWMYFTSLALMIGAVFNRQCELLLSPLAPFQPDAEVSKPTSGNLPKTEKL